MVLLVTRAQCPRITVLYKSAGPRPFCRTYPAIDPAPTIPWNLREYKFRTAITYVVSYDAIRRDGMEKRTQERRAGRCVSPRLFYKAASPASFFRMTPGQVAYANETTRLRWLENLRSTQNFDLEGKFNSGWRERGGESRYTGRNGRIPVLNE